jgi:SPP1 gp7 family putative phage head morphogenesis protein
MDAIKRAVLKTIGKDDAFMMKGTTQGVVLHTWPVKNLAPKSTYAFVSNPKKVEDFRSWLQEQIDKGLMTTVGGTSGKPWTAKYIETAYRKGAARAYVDAHKAKLGLPMDFYDGNAEAFLRDAFFGPQLLSKMELVATRAFGELRGVSDTMSQQLSRTMAEGLANGWHPLKTAREMTKQIDGLTAKRAKVIARTETIRAHAEGQLDAFDALGVDELGVMAEWQTAGYDVCEDCLGMEGQTFTVEEARGYIPLHPNCRCAWIPAFEKSKAKSGAKAREPLASVPGDLRKELYGAIDSGAAKSVEDLYAAFGDRSVARFWLTGGVDDAKWAVVKQAVETGRFKPAAIRKLLDDVQAGREKPSLMRVGRNYIDPRLRIAGVKQKDINDLGDYLVNLFNDAGIKMTKGGKLVKPPKIKPPKIKPPAPTGIAPTPAPTGIAPTPAPTSAGTTRYASAEEYRKAIIDAVEKRPGAKEIADLEYQLKIYAQERVDARSTWHELLASSDAKAAQAFYDNNVIAIDNKYFKLHNEVMTLKNATQVALKEQRKLLAEVDSAVDFMTHVGGDIKEFKATLNEVMSWVPKKAISKSDEIGIRNLTVRISKSGPKNVGGEYAFTTRQISIYRSGYSAQQIFAHELGHHLSYQMSRFMKAQNAFFNRRTASEAIRELPRFRGINGKADQFSRYSQYAGRVYSDGHASEIASVGVEYIWANPYKAATADPEWFNMVVSALKGIPEK